MKRSYLMAIWQFKLMLLPKEWVKANKYRITRQLIDEGWELGEVWRCYDGTPNPEDVIDRYLSRTKSWHTDLIIWGDKETDDIQLFYDNGNIDDLQIRIDARKNSSEMIGYSTKIALELNCQILLMENATVIDPLDELLRSYLSRSTAVKFAEDPYGTLANLEPIRIPNYEAEKN